MSETEATAAPTAEEIKGTKRAAEVSSFKAFKRRYRPRHSEKR